MGDIVFVEKCKTLQGLLEDAFCYSNRIANVHPSLARFELRQLLDHSIDTRTHGLNDQAFADSIGAVVFELS